MRELVGCLGALIVAFLIIPLLVASFAAASIGLALQGMNPLNAVSGLSYNAGGAQSGARTIHDLGFGSSDTARVNTMVEAIAPDSPVVGHGATILKAATANRVDPLLIAQWQFESSMGTTGVNKQHNPGSMIWPAMAPYADEYGCKPGPTSLGHRWGWCPDIDSSISIWFKYVGTYYPQRNLDSFYRYVEVYNPCSDPANGGRFTCGKAYGDAILSLIKRTAGPANIAGGSAVPGGSTISDSCPTQPSPPPNALSQEAKGFARSNPQVSRIITSAVHRDDWSIAQGWGPTSFPKEVSWEGYKNFHVGEDVNFPGDDNQPAYAVDSGTTTPVIWPDGNRTEYLTLANGVTWRYLHLSVQIARGPVKQGDVMGKIGSTGNSNGAHLHLEMSRSYEDTNWIYPGQWPCRSKG